MREWCKLFAIVDYNDFLDIVKLIYTSFLNFSKNDKRSRTDTVWYRDLWYILKLTNIGSTCINNMYNITYYYNITSRLYSRREEVHTKLFIYVPCEMEKMKMCRSKPYCTVITVILPVLIKINSRKPFLKSKEKRSEYLWNYVLW